MSLHPIKKFSYLIIIVISFILTITVASFFSSIASDNEIISELIQQPLTNEDTTQYITLPLEENEGQNNNKDTIIENNNIDLSSGADNLTETTTLIEDTGIFNTGEVIIDINTGHDFISGSKDDNTIITYIEDYILETDQKEGNDTIDQNQDIIEQPKENIEITAPSKSLVLDSQGRLIKDTIESYNVIDHNSDNTYCSYITYLNINNILKASDIQSGIKPIIRGNAIDIWNTTIKKLSYTSASENSIFTGTNQTGATFINVLESLYRSHNATVIDIVTKQPTSPDGSTIRQSHRFTIIYASDSKWYVLDPVRTQMQEPIPLVEYLSTYIYDHEDIAIVQSHTLTQQGNFLESPLFHNKKITTIQGSQALLNHIINTNNKPLGRKSQNKSTNSELTINSGFLYLDETESVSAYLPDGLHIQTAEGTLFDINSFVIQEEKPIQNSLQAIIDSTVTFNGDNYILPTYVGELIPYIGPLTTLKKEQGIHQFNTPSSSEEGIIKTIKFGQINEHLIFSQPVPILIQVPDSDGTPIEVQVYHEGQEGFTADSLSTNPNTQCNNGQAEDQNNLTIVEDGIVTIYTCGASTFMFSYTGGANATHYIDNGTKDFSITISTGVQFDTGSLINDINIGIDFRPIDNESPTGPRGTTNCYPNEKSFILIHPDGTQVSLATAGTYTTPNTNCPQAQITYDQEATSPVAGGIWNLNGEGRQPVGSLSTLYNKSPFGTWTIRAGDNAGADGLIFYGFNLNVDASAPICGDGILQTGSSEQCDDSNSTNGDGCSLSCQIESGRECTGTPSSCSLIPSATGLIVQYDGSVTGAGLFTDISGNGNNATSFNGVTTANQNGETVMCFNGTNQYLERVGNLVTSYPFTMSSWVRTNNTTGIKGVISYARSNSTSVMYNTELNATIRRQNAQNTTARYTNGTTPANATEWFLVTTVFTSPTNRQIYVNGVLQGTNTVSTAYDTNVNKRLNIGRFADSTPSNYFGGCIDDIRMYNTSLSSGQIYTIYAKPATLTTSLVMTGSPLLTGTIQGPLDSIFITLNGTTYTGTNHGNGTWSLPSGIISPSLGTGLQNTILTVTNPYNRSVQYSGSFIVELPSIAPGDICIYAPSALHIGSINGSNTGQSMNIQSEYFTLDDSKGSLSGYYTTLSISDLTSTGSTISKSNIQIKADPITTLSGSTNPAVILDSSILSFTSLSSPVTFIKRNSGTGGGIKGIYGSKINLQVNIPAYQTIGTYTGTLTYTLYEN
ncbi:hypothetical protein XF24_00824 [candidate division SR1 bacterium Aalborg_AAW-1]|nr:hypothetical protein XF24_00824 [candidate division SR1 bacterium Aalborg_AAW-1]